MTVRKAIKPSIKHRWDSFEFIGWIGRRLQRGGIHVHTYTAALNVQITTYDAKMITLDAQITTLQQEVYDLTNPP